VTDLEAVAMGMVALASLTTLVLFGIHRLRHRNDRRRPGG
jgi:hypothetical protein